MLTPDAVGGYAKNEEVEARSVYPPGSEKSNEWRRELPVFMPMILVGLNIPMVGASYTREGIQEAVIEIRNRNGMVVSFLILQVGGGERNAC